MKPLPAALFLFLALLPGCRCTTTDVVYGDDLEPATENDLVETLEAGVQRCVREGESERCVSKDRSFDTYETVRDFQLVWGRSSCRADDRAQVEAIAFFGGTTFSVVAGTFSHRWTGNWTLERVEFLGFPDHFRICEAFGEEHRHEDVTVVDNTDVHPDSVALHPACRQHCPGPPPSEALSDLNNRPVSISRKIGGCREDLPLSCRGYCV